MRNRTRLARGGRGIARGEQQVVKAAQYEMSPAALRRKTLKAQNLFLAEREGVLWRYYSRAHDAGSAHHSDGHPEAVEAAGELTKCLVLSALV